MKKFGIKIIFTIILMLFSVTRVNAIQFDVLVLPTDIFNVCDNYFVSLSLQKLQQIMLFKI